MENETISWLLILSIITSLSLGYIIGYIHAIKEITQQKMENI